MNKTLYISITLVSVVLGLMVAFQFRTAGRVDSGVPIDRVQLLTTELKQLDKEYATLVNESKDLEQKLAQAEKGRPQASQAVQEELEKIRQLAGLTKLQGPGVEVNLSPLTKGENLFTVRDEDLLRVINELRAAGAEALAINGQRIVATSEIRLAGSFIDVNLTRISAPYSVLAIGSPGQLESALLIKGGLVDTMRDWGVSVTVNKKETVTVPAYTHRINLEYAKPLKEEG
ncbi:protein of unknown function DUF881 [Desulforamulus reducens MI-1]|uniref:DUF881 domain-containing protein n=1 Tax=Desulforamulus reducens (strain ATCC BAA-1160 / DSM 100696 / MI-1) TaxID=349161 RepID=A4J2B7_DESRM|nr:DUF881 domain-containing protein [Desulforamulus reducens]ABO49220.1 protein of unknown function DUF881 [Desulforamulus reducens MI-1]